MKHTKMISVIIIAAILCAGCADTKDESGVPEATTTAATTTETTTAQTDQIRSSVDDNRNITNTDELDPANPIPESTKPSVAPDTDKPIENDNLPTDPSTVVNPTLVGHESQNPDGTYTAELVAGVTRPGTGEAVTQSQIDKWINRGSCGEANPSKIPYSQITVENAAEAFPYLGDFVGYVPNYIEIEPGMTTEQIEIAIAKNYAGFSPEEYSDRFIYSSQADYDAEMARREQQAEENRLLGQEATEFGEAVISGEASIGDGGTGEGLNEFFDSLYQ